MKLVDSKWVIAIYAAVVLAGGASRRMGRDKLLLEVDGLTLLEAAVNRFKEEFADVCVSVAENGKYPQIKAREIVDVRRGAGPLSGLHAALANLRHDHDGVFVVAADLPYSSPKAALRIIELCGDHDACIIRLANGNIEPLFGYYKKTLLPLCEEALSSGDNRMSEVLYKADTRFIPPEELGELWNEKLIFNINYPDDYSRVSG